MKVRSLLVSFIAVFALALTLSVVSADGLDITSVKVDNVALTAGDVASTYATAGDTVNVRVKYTADVDARDVVIKVELGDAVVKQKVGIAKNDGTVKEAVLKLVVPSDFKRDTVEKTEDFEVTIEGEAITNCTGIDSGDDVDGEFNSKIIILKQDYNADVKSVVVASNVAAGKTIPVDIVIKNNGYLDLEDVYVTVKITSLGIEKTVYFGDLVSIESCDDECDEDETDTISGRLYLEIPYEAQAGVYALEVVITTDDSTSSAVKQIAISNDFSSGNVVVASNSKTVAAGEDAVYTLMVVNPTDSVKVYRIVADSSADLSVRASDSVVVVPAGSSKTVTVTANSDKEGDYNFKVNVFSGEKLENAIALSTKVEGSSSKLSSPVVVLSIILAIIFLVLLVVLIVLLGKKPEKSEEFGESYY